MPNAKSRKQIRRGKSRRQTPAVKPKVLANNVSPRPVVPRVPRRAPQASHASRVCSVTDPFCPASKGSKWPDGTAGNTLTEQFRGTVVMPSTAAGNNAYVFTSGLPYGFIPSASATSTVVTLAAAFTTYKSGSMFETYGQEYRIVSFGVIVRCIASATNASGLVTLGTTGNVALGSALTLGTQLYDEVIVKAIQPGMEVSWIAQPKGTDARSFNSITSASATGALDWSELVVEMSGAPVSTNMLSIEWFINCEFTLKLNSGLSTLAKPNPPKIPAAETAVSKIHSSVGSFIEGGVKQVEDTIMNHATNALSSLMSDPLESLAALFSAI